MTHTTAINYCAAGRFQAAWRVPVEAFCVLNGLTCLAGEGAFMDRLGDALLVAWEEDLAVLTEPQTADEVLTFILHDNTRDWTLLVGEHAYGAACAMHLKPSEDWQPSSEVVAEGERVAETIVRTAGWLAENGSEPVRDEDIGEGPTLLDRLEDDLAGRPPDATSHSEAALEAVNEAYAAMETRFPVAPGGGITHLGDPSPDEPPAVTLDEAVAEVSEDD